MPAPFPSPCLSSLAARHYSSFIAKAGRNETGREDRQLSFPRLDEFHQEQPRLRFRRPVHETEPDRSEALAFGLRQTVRQAADMVDETDTTRRLHQILSRR